MLHHRTLTILIPVFLIMTTVSWLMGGQAVKTTVLAKGGKTPTALSTQPKSTPIGRQPPTSTPGTAIDVPPSDSSDIQSDNLNTSVQDASAGDVRGYWQFLGNEGSLIDSSTYGNNGTDIPLGSARYRPGVGLKGQIGIDSMGLARNGIEVPVRLANTGNSLVVSGDQITLEGWVKNDDYGPGFHHIIDNMDGYALSIVNGRPAAMFRGPTNWWTPTNIPLLSPYQWYYIVATYDGSWERIYVNGEFIASQQASGPISTGTAQVSIGGRGNGGSDCNFKGTLDGRPRHCSSFE